MNLVIDIGNTRVKAAVFLDNEIIFNESFSLQNLKRRLKIITEKYLIKNVIISSVGGLINSDLDFLYDKFNVLELDSTTRAPFINKYKTPTTLGVDRIALMAACSSQFSNQNVLVFDVGSCITYDFINDKNEYIGGGISPGIEMRYKSLNFYTAGLPKLEVPMKITKQGDTTDNAIHLGVLNGVIFEIEGVIRMFNAKNEKLTIVLTGGDTIFLAKNIKSTIFANPNFLLEGLNSILTYNIGV